MKAQVVNLSSVPETFERQRNPSSLVWMSPSLASEEGRTAVEVTPTTLELRRERRVFRTDVIAFRPDPAFLARTTETLMPILRLHCPKHKGCKATESLSLTETSNITLRMQLPGVGLSSAFAFEIATDQSWSTEDGHCLEVVVPLVLSLTYGEYLFNDDRLAMGFNLSLEHYDPLVQVQREIPTDLDLCQLPGQSQQVVPLAGQLQVTSGESDVSFETKTTVTGEHRVGFSVFGETLNIAVGYQRTASQASTREYHLAPGGTYQPFAVGASDAAHAAEIIWRTS